MKDNQEENASKAQDAAAEEDPNEVDVDDLPPAEDTQAAADDRLTRPVQQVEVPPLTPDVSAVTFKSNALFVPNLYPTNSDVVAGTTNAPQPRDGGGVNNNGMATLAETESPSDEGGQPNTNTNTNSGAAEEPGLSRKQILILTGNDDTVVDEESTAAGTTTQGAGAGANGAPQGNNNTNNKPVDRVAADETIKQIILAETAEAAKKDALVKVGYQDANNLKVEERTVATLTVQPKDDATTSAASSDPATASTTTDPSTDIPSTTAGTSTDVDVDDVEAANNAGNQDPANPPRVPAPEVAAADEEEEGAVPINRPGALAVTIGSGAAAQEEEAAPADEETGNSNNAARGGTSEDQDPETAPEPLVSATLVNDDHTGDLVQAEPAEEGITAMLHNKYFKPVACSVFIVIVLAVAIPLSIRSPNEPAAAPVNATVETPPLTPDQVCGTRGEHQGDYRGNLSVTEIGIECQRWDSQFPHNHQFTPTDIENFDMANNHCRNPCGICEPRAWCYTTDPDVRWAYCDIPFCGINNDDFPPREECGHAEVGGADYRGNISVSGAGNTCKNWDEVPTSNKAALRPQAGLEGNYCRNPDSTYPFCYTTEENLREFCDLPQCPFLAPEGSQFEGYCEDCNLLQCGTLRLGQMDYRGPRNVSLNGHACKPWSDKYSEEERHFFGLEENYCRNTLETQSPFAWCWTDEVNSTDDEPTWDVCDIPRCADTLVKRRQCGSRTMNQGDYRGQVKVSESGKPCAYWIGTDAILEGKTPFHMPWEGLIADYCRNPLGGMLDPLNRNRAWCYVSHLEGEPNWEYCAVDFCQDCGTRRLNYQDYSGTQSVSQSGKECLAWEGMEDFLVQANNSLAQYIEVSEVTLLYTHGMRRDLHLEANYCRNPLNKDGAFCYVDKDGSWEYCDIDECELDTSTVCGSQDVAQADYRGDVNTSATGKECIPWNLQDEFAPEAYPSSGLDGAYCRQPAAAGRLGAWCYVDETDLTWEYCAVPVCPVDD